MILDSLDPVPFCLAVIAGLASLYFHWDWQGRVLARPMPACVETRRLLSENKQVHFFLGVRLDPRFSDGRIAEITVGPPCWKGIEEGDEVEVVAMPHRPPWLFWSPLIWASDVDGEAEYPVLAFVFGVLAAILLVMAVF